MKCCSGRSDLERHLLAGLERGQALLVLALDVGLVLVMVLVIRGEESRLQQRLAIGAEHVAIRAGRAARAGDEVHRHRVEYRGRHLAGDGALPDQRIKAALVLVVQVRLGLLRRLGRRRWPDRLVGFLRILRLGLVDIHAVGKRLLAEGRADDVAHLGDRALSTGSPSPCACR